MHHISCITVPDANLKDILHGFLFAGVCHIRRAEVIDTKRIRAYVEEFCYPIIPVVMNEGIHLAVMTVHQNVYNCLGRSSVFTNAAYAYPLVYAGKFIGLPVHHDRLGKLCTITLTDELYYIACLKLCNHAVEADGKMRCVCAVTKTEMDSCAGAQMNPLHRQRIGTPLFFLFCITL